MKINSVIFWILTVFFAVITTTYTLWSVISEHSIEWSGTIGLGFCGLLSLLLGFYMTRSHAAQGGEFPEDRADANIDDGDPEMGFFNPYSWWPIALAAGCTLSFLGLAVGVWICFIGGAVVAVALVGWVYENYRGIHQH